MLAVLAGVVLLLVPTLFGLFPSWADWSSTIRIAIAVVWGLVAIVGVVGQVHRDQLTDEDLQNRVLRSTQRSNDALTRILDDLLAPGRRAPVGYECTVYVVDRESGALVPLWPLEPEDARQLRTFQPGKGATGIAYERACKARTRDEREATVVVTGDAVSNDEKGLTPGQQQFFKTFQAVVAVPLWLDRSQPAGALTAISIENDGHFDDETNRAEFRQLARTVAEVVYATINPEEI